MCQCSECLISELKNIKSIVNKEFDELNYDGEYEHNYDSLMIIALNYKAELLKIKELVKDF